MPSSTKSERCIAPTQPASSRAIILIALLLLGSSFAGCDKTDRDSTGPNSAATGTSGESEDVDASRQAIPAFTGTVPRLMRYEGVAGYDEPSMAAFGDACIAGQVPKDPQHTFRVEELTAIEFRVQGEDDDLSLVIEGPGGPYCNDDYDGLDAGMQLELQPGEYSVYVGTYSDEPLDPTPAYTFVISDPEGSLPRNPVLSLLDTRLDELIETSESGQKSQLERLQVLLRGIGQRRGRAIEVQSVEDLKRMLNALNLDEAERTEMNALIERLEREAATTGDDAATPGDDDRAQ